MTSRREARRERERRGERRESEIKEKRKTPPATRANDK